ncbi:MAG: 3-oxoacid CoA-transferase subunit B [Chloroflexi bacterium]|nr:3-oxoacid CoA-transferase subunit B [Chloroflexota bacterium]
MRIARELEDGWYVNLGIGLPTLVANYLPPDKLVVIHSENGVLGVGPAPELGQEDPDLCNAGGQPVTLIPGGCLFGHAESFAIIRGRHLDVAVLGALQVSEGGDLANWMLPQRGVGSIGGGADIARGAKRVYVAMEHTTREGEPKILRQCSYPLTGRGVVNAIFTDLAVIRVSPQGLLLEEIAPGWTPEEVQARTEPRLMVSPALREIRL